MSTIELISTILSVVLVFIAFYALVVAKEQLIANDSPRLLIQRHQYKTSIGENDNFIKIEVRNFGNGMCLDGIFLIKRKNKLFNSNYYISKPTRVIEPKQKKEVLLDLDSSFDLDKVERMFVYKDFFGREYLAGDYSLDFNNSHLKVLSKKAKILTWYKWDYWKYRLWQCMAIKQGNTYADKLNSTKKESLEKLISEYNVKEGFFS